MYEGTNFETQMCIIRIIWRSAADAAALNLIEMVASSAPQEWAAALRLQARCGGFHHAKINNMKSINFEQMN